MAVGRKGEEWKMKDKVNQKAGRAISAPLGASHTMVEMPAMVVVTFQNVNDRSHNQWKWLISCFVNLACVSCTVSALHYNISSAKLRNHPYILQCAVSSQGLSRRVTSIASGKVVTFMVHATVCSLRLGWQTQICYPRRVIPDIVICFIIGSPIASD